MKPTDPHHPVNPSPAPPDGAATNYRVAPTDPDATRDISVVPAEDTHTRSIGDRIRVCAQVNRACHLTVVNIGPTGNVTVLLPNAHHPETAVGADQVVTFPAPGDRFSIQLTGPPGPERLIALASTGPLRLTPRDFDQSGQLVARPTTRNIAIIADEVAPEVLGLCEIEFYGSDREGSSAPAGTRGGPPGEPAGTGSPFRSLDLG
jgi:hypothetical protein